MSYISLIYLVMMKELRENLRDKRSVFSALLFPFLGPLLMYFIFTGMAEQINRAKYIVLPVSGAEYATDLIDWLTQQGVDVVPIKHDPYTVVKEEKLDFILAITPTYQDNFHQGKPANLILYSDSSRNDSRTSILKVQQLLQIYSGQIASMRLLARGIDAKVVQVVNVVNIEVASLQKKAALAMNFIPLFILLAAFICGMQIAVDATAGERERGSLEALLLNPVPRLVLVMGKWFAAVAFSATGVILTLIVCILALHLMPTADLGLHPVLGLREFIGLLAAILPMAFLATALQILLASFARSFKEAQTYISLLVLFPTLPGLFSTIYSIDVQTWMMGVPALAQQLLLTAVLGGEVIIFSHFILAGISSLLLAFLGIILTSKLFRHEAIIFGT